MRTWLREEILRRVLRNAGLLGAGKAAGAILHLAGLALTARMLGPVAFGLLIVLRSYAQAASGLARFQSWQTLIRFGAVRAHEGDRAGFRDLAAFTVALDAATGLVAALAAILLAPMFGLWFGVTPESIRLAQLYCVVIPLMASATPTGILRIFDRFDLLSRQNVVTPAVRLAGIGVAALLGAPLWAMVTAWLVSDLVGDLYLWRQAWGELKRRKLVGGAMPSPIRAVSQNRNIIGFSLAANGVATLNQAATPLFTLLVGALLGPAAAGLYRVAQVVLEAAAAPGELAMRSLFPELARLLERDRRHFWRLVGRALILSAGLGLILALIVEAAGPFLLIVCVGADYAGAVPVLRIVALSIPPSLAVFPLETALLAMGLAGRLLLVRALAALVAFATAAWLAQQLGLSGIGIAVTFGASAALVGMLLLLVRRQ